MARRAVNTNRQGASFELMIMDDLQTHGFDALRSSGSRGVADVIAFGSGDSGVEMLLIQAKISQPLIPPAEREALWSLTRRTGAVPVTAFRAGGKPHYRELTGTGPKDWIPFVPRRTCDDILRGVLQGPVIFCGLPPRHSDRHFSDGCYWTNFHPGEDALKFSQDPKGLPV